MDFINIIIKHDWDKQEPVIYKLQTFLKYKQVKITFSYFRITLRVSNRFWIGKRHWYRIYLSISTYIWVPPRTFPRVERPFAVPHDRKNSELERFQNRKKNSREKTRRCASPLIVVGQYVVSQRRRWQCEGTGPIKNRQNRQVRWVEGRSGPVGFR